MYEGEREIKTGSGEEREEGQKMRVVPLTKESIPHVLLVLVRKSSGLFVIVCYPLTKEGQKMRAVALTKESIPHVFLV